MSRATATIRAGTRPSRSWRRCSPPDAGEAFAAGEDRFTRRLHCQSLSVRPEHDARFHETAGENASIIAAPAGRGFFLVTDARGRQATRLAIRNRGSGEAKMATRLHIRNPAEWAVDQVISAGAA